MLANTGGTAVLAENEALPAISNPLSGALTCGNSVVTDPAAAVDEEEEEEEEEEAKVAFPIKVSAKLVDPVDRINTSAAAASLFVFSTAI